MLRYDESNLITRLEALSPRARVAFAAACAERLRAYVGYPNSPPTPTVLKGALEALQRAIHKELPDATLQAELQQQANDLDLLLHIAIKSRQSSQELARQAILVMPYKNRINLTALRAARYPARSVRRHESRSGTAKE